METINLILKPKINFEVPKRSSSLLTKKSLELLTFSRLSQHPNVQHKYLQNKIKF